PTAKEIKDIISTWCNYITNKESNEFTAQIKETDDLISNTPVSFNSNIHPVIIYNSKQFDCLSSTFQRC
ncbi:14579_t:CDS:1, partial [Dentiscutata erythropus]